MTRAQEVTQMRQIMSKAADMLSEHFDSVQIIGSTTRESVTSCVKEGRGDWYARVGMVREWLIQDAAMVSKDSGAAPSDEDGPETWQFL